MLSCKHYFTNKNTLEINTELLVLNIDLHIYNYFEFGTSQIYN